MLKGGVSRANAELLVAALSPSPSRERGFAGCCWIRGGDLQLFTSSLPSTSRERGSLAAAGFALGDLQLFTLSPALYLEGEGGLLAAAGFAGGAAVFHPLPCPLPRGRGGLLAAAGFALGGALADAWLAQRQGLWGCQGGGGGELDSHQLLVGHAVVLPLALIADLDEIVGGHGHNTVEA